MAMRQYVGYGKSPVQNTPPVEMENTGRTLTLLVEGVALNTLEVECANYQEFRAAMTQLAQSLPDRLPDADKLAIIKTVLQECERYRSLSEQEMRERLAGWRTLVAKLMTDLLPRLGIDASKGAAAVMLRRVASLLTAAEIHGFLVELTDFFRVSSMDGRTSRLAQLKEADRSTANDNAAGLRGGGAAVEHVQRIMDRNVAGAVVLFQLNCLEMIGDRFGMEAVQDSLMAVSAFLTHSLRSDDAVYHWSDSSLLAVLQTPVSIETLTTAMRRIVDNNRDITIQVGGRTVMLRIPLDFEITPISRLSAAEDLNRLPAPSATRR